MTGEFPAQMAINAEDVSIRWRHHVLCILHKGPMGQIGYFTVSKPLFHKSIISLPYVDPAH